MGETDQIDAERKDSIIKEAYSKISTLTKKGYKAREQSSDLKKWLEKQDEVEEVTVYGVADLTVKFKDKTQVGILLDRRKFYGGCSNENSNSPDGPNFSVCNGDPHPVSRKAAVIDTLRDDWPPASTPDNIYGLLNAAGYDVDYIKSDAANLDFFTTFDDKEYGVVFIRSHGGVMNVNGNDKLHIMVRPFFASFPPASGHTGVGVFTVGTDVLPQGFAYAYAFNDDFVKQYMNNRQFPNSLFHLLVCQSANPLAQDDMIKSFLDRGVGCYTGWTDNASSADGDPAAVQFFQVLCDSSANPINTVEKAIDQIKSSGHSPDPGTGAELVAHGSDAMQIIKCFILKEVSHIEIQEPGGKILRKGFHDVLDAMEYGTNQILGGKYSELHIVHNVELKKVQW